MDNADRDELLELIEARTAGKMSEEDVITILKNQIMSALELSIDTTRNHDEIEVSVKLTWNGEFVASAQDIVEV